MKFTVCVLFLLYLYLSPSTQTENFVSRNSADLFPKYDHVIYVDPLNPNSTNSSTCFTSSEQKPCSDINFALSFPHKQFSTKFVLSPDTTHYLENNSLTTVFEGGTHIALYGDANNSAVIIECQPGGGLSFINSTDITIQGISFVNCGAVRNSTSRDFTRTEFKLKTFQVGLYFYNCRDVSLLHMSVLNGTDALGVVMYSTVGTNHIAHSHFNDNRISNSAVSGGGGFAVEFTFCKPGDDQCSDENYQIYNNSKASYTFDNCTFSNNRAVDQINGSVVFPAKENHSSFGCGGGLSVYFKGTSLNNSIIIHKCTFSRNHANWGGGLLVEFEDNAIQNVVNVSECQFFVNHCYYFNKTGVSGGGMRVASSVYYNAKRNKSLSRNSVFISNSNFSDNRALSGGGLSLSFHRQRLSCDLQVFQVNVTNCTFDSNYARLGSAVSIEHGHFYPEGKIGEALFHNCRFYHNRILYTNSFKPYSVGIGAVHISDVLVSFSGQTVFEQNNGTALAIVGTSVNFTGDHVSFLDNEGSRGGAISLLGVADIIIGEGTKMMFINNRAKLYGGAIYNQYIGMEDLRSSLKCFLQYSIPFVSPNQWNATFLFSGNMAEKLGHSIFSSTILPCSRPGGIQADLDAVADRSIFCWNSSIWFYVNSNCTDQIHSFPRTFGLAGAKKNIFPGHSFHLNITAYDDLGHDVTTEAVYTAKVYSGNVSTARVLPEYTYITDGYVGITGRENQRITLELDSAGLRDFHIELPITLQRCPPGFRQNLSTNHNDSSIKDIVDVSTLQCVCSAVSAQRYSFRGNLFCDDNNFSSLIRNTYWIGIVPEINNDTLLMAESLSAFKIAALGEFRTLSQHWEDLNELQCGSLNRTETLCGKCVHGFATAVNSPIFRCVPCSSNTTNIPLNIFVYIALTYIPNLLLFLFIIYFDIRVMSGPAVGFILYAQLVGAGLFDLSTDGLAYVNAGDVPRKLEKAYHIVFGILNLESLSQLMDPFCVSESFSALDVISLDIAIAVFPLFLIILILLILKLKTIKFRERERQRRIRDMTSVNAIQSIDKVRGRSLLHPFIAFIYLSYTKFSITSTKLLSTTQLFDENGNGVEPRIVYHAGQYTLNDPHYLFPYGLIGVLVFIFFAALLPLLLLGPFQFIDWLIDKPRFERLRKYWPSLRVHIFLDALQGCYKLNRWYFTGIYFLFRLILFIVFACSPNAITFLLWQQFFCTIMIILVAFFQPYKVKFYNYVDILIFFNLTIINGISIYLYTSHVENMRTEFPLAWFVIGFIIIWLPLLYMLLYLGWMGLQKSSCYPTIRERLKPFRQLCEPLFNSESDDPERRPLLNPISKTDIQSEPDSLSDSGMFRRAESPNHFRPYNRTPITSTIVTAYGSGGTADVYGTQLTASSGIVSGDTNTGSSQSSRVQSTDTD